MRLLVAISGGIDSVVLVHLLSEAGIPFAIAHCNFTLREDESNRDEQFVKDLATRYKVPLFVQTFNTGNYASEHKISIQEAARNLRYGWFLELLKKEAGSLSFVATAHHANDNIETLLINFFRGTGIGGLHGMLPRQHKIIRPLLFARRAEIEQYANEHSLLWVEDSSNASDKYTRNLFRHQLLPILTKAFTGVEENLLQNIGRFTEAEMLYNEAVNLHKKNLLENKGKEVHIPALKLAKIKPLASVLWEIVKEYSFSSSQLPDITNLLVAENGKYVASATHRIIKNRAWLIIAPVQTGEAHHIVIEKGEKSIVYDDAVLTLQTAALNNHHQVSADSHTAMLDAREIQYPLLLRKWKAGDYFYPLGMKKKKKLSKFFIDNKLSKTEKENVWVVEMNQKIIWVVGYRIDDRFKIKDSTKQLLVLHTKTNSA